MKTKKIILFALVAGFLRAAAMAEMPAAQFLLDSNPNPRLYSMGNALSAIDCSDSYSNPASLGWTVNRGFYFSRWPGEMKDSSYNYLSGVFPVFKKNYLGFSYLSYTSGSEIIEELDGTSRSITLENNSVIGISLGMALNSKFFVGGALKYLSSTLAEDYSADALLLDLNVMNRSLDDRETWELGIFNYGSGIKYASVKEKLPTELRLGYTRRLNVKGPYSLLASGSYGRVMGGGFNSLSGGLEFTPGVSILAARAGFIKKTDKDLEWTIGFGLKVSGVAMDFAYAIRKKDYEQSAPYRFSLHYNFGASSLYEAGEAYIRRGMKEKALALWNEIKPGDRDYSAARVKINTYMDPPALAIETRFASSSGADIISGGQEGNIIVAIKNTGKSPALDINVELLSVGGLPEGLRIMPYGSKIVSIMPGQTERIEIPVMVEEEIAFSSAAFTVKVTEGRGFNPPVLPFTLKAKALPPPKPLLVRYTFREDNTGQSQGNGNGILEKGEIAEFTGILANIGESQARKVRVSLKSPGLQIIKNISESSPYAEIGALNPGEYKKVIFVVKIPENYSGPVKLPLSLKIDEERARYSRIQNLNLSLGKFYVDPLTASETEFSEILARLPDIPGPVPGGRAAEVVRSFSGGAPDLDFTSSVSGDENGNGVYEPGEKIILSVNIRNSGIARAKAVKVIISGDKTAASLLGSPYLIGDIAPGKSQRVILSAGIPTSIPRKTANFNVRITEGKGFNPGKTEAKSVGFQPKEVVMAKNYPALLPAPLQAGYIRRNSAALVIGISRYQSISSGLKYAVSDAGVVKKYLKGVVGVPEENIKILSDEKATKSIIEAEISRISGRKPESVFLYFAGHGIFDQDDPRSGNPFLVPYDAYLDYGNKMLVSLKNIVSELEASGAREVFIMLDSCFSGEGGIGKEKQLLAKRAIAIEPVLDYRKSVIISAASGRQMAGEFDKAGGHGYFTYYLLLGLKGEADADRNGAITDLELCEYVKKKVDEETAGNQTPECKNAKGSIMGRYR